MIKKNATYHWPIWTVILFVATLIVVGVSLHTHNAAAAASQVVGFQLTDHGCGDRTQDGPQSLATDIGAWTNWAGDSDSYDPDCLRMYVGNSIPKDTDIRIGIQARDVNTPCGFLWLFKCGDGGGPIIYGPWASQGYDSGWSAWTSDADTWAPDQWRFVVQASSTVWYGRTVSDFSLALQTSRDRAGSSGWGPGCGVDISPTQNTASSSVRDWSGWAYENSVYFNCVRVDLLATSTLNDPTALFTGTTTAPLNDSIDIPYDVEYINTSTGCTIAGRYADGSLADASTTINANGGGSKTSVAIIQPVTYFLYCNGFKSGTSASTQITLSPFATTPPAIDFKMNPTSLSAGGMSTATVAVVNTSGSTQSCTLTGYAVDGSGNTTGTVVDATDPSFTVAPESATIAATPSTQTDVYYLTVYNSGAGMITSGNFTVPANWNNGNNSIEVIGAGANSNVVANKGGGGGGAYSKVSNLTLTPGNSISYGIGLYGSGANSGGDTWFNRTAGSSGTCSDTSSVCAKGGSPPVDATSGGMGGQASSGLPAGATCTVGALNMRCSGGNGGGGTSGGGGGGAAGPHGVGGNGGNSTGSNNGGTGGGGGDGGSNGVALNGGSNNGSAGGSGYVGAGGVGGTGTNAGTAAPTGNGGGGGGASDGSTRGNGGNGGWNMTWCANEGGTCTVTGTQTVIFAAPTSLGQSFAQQFTNTTVSCSTGTFGDPASGIVKNCFIADPASLSGGGAGRGGWNGSGNSGAKGGLYGGGASGGGLVAIAGVGVIIIKNTYSAKTYLTDANVTSWRVPNDWNNSNNTIEVIGGGGAGGGGRTAGGNGSTGFGAGGGGGGAYSKIVNLHLTPGTNVTYAIGVGGTGGIGTGTNTGKGGDGGDTYFNGTGCGASSVCAKGGTGASRNGAAGGMGGPVFVASTTYVGGNGATGGDWGGSGGGGAAGPLGIGKNAGNSSNSVSGSSGGGNGNGFNGQNSPNFTTAGNGGNNAQNYGGGNGTNSGAGGDGTDGGGGGGGGGNSTGKGGDGGNGIEWSVGNGSAIAGSGGGGGGGSTTNNNSTQVSPGGLGGLYGAGGGGGSHAASAGAQGGGGGQGIIVISYSSSPALVNNIGTHTSKHTVNVTTDYTVLCTPSNASKTVRVSLSACFLDGVTINNGASSGPFYKQSQSDSGYACSDNISRGCSSGALTGDSTYKYASCVNQSTVIIRANMIQNTTAVRKGSNTAIGWDGGNADNCTITGTDGTNLLNRDPVATTSVTVNQKTVYTATCTKGATVSKASVTVNLLPNVIEI